MLEKVVSQNRKDNDMNDEKIKALLEFYEFPIYLTTIVKLAGYIVYDYKSVKLRQIAELIKLLRCCKGSKLEIIGTIQEPHKGQVKGELIKCKLDNEYTSKIEAHINSLLREELEGYASIDENWNYSDEILDSIIEKGKQEEEYLQKFSRSRRLGQICHMLHGALSKDIDMVFENVNKTKIYSLIYDVLALTNQVSDKGKGFSGGIGKEKYQEVKNWINAYNNMPPKKDYLLLSCDMFKKGQENEVKE